MNPRTYCGICWDVGAVSIWHPDTLSSLRRGDERTKLSEANVACTCKRGSTYATKLKHGQSGPWLDRFGSQPWHVRRTIRRTEAGLFDPAADVAEFGSAELQSFCAGQLTANYQTGFDRFNNGG